MKCRCVHGGGVNDCSSDTCLVRFEWGFYLHSSQMVICPLFFPNRLSLCWWRIGSFPTWYALWGWRERDHICLTGDMIYIRGVIVNSVTHCTFIVLTAYNFTNNREAVAINVEKGLFVVIIVFHQILNVFLESISLVSHFSHTFPVFGMHILLDWKVWRWKD